MRASHLIVAAVAAYAFLADGGSARPADARLEPMDTNAPMESDVYEETMEFSTVLDTNLNSGSPLMPHAGAQLEHIGRRAGVSNDSFAAAESSQYNMASAAAGFVLLALAVFVATLFSRRRRRISIPSPRLGLQKTKMVNRRSSEPPARELYTSGRIHSASSPLSTSRSAGPASPTCGSADPIYKGVLSTSSSWSDLAGPMTKHF